jgi:hypothetical protein
MLLSLVHLLHVALADTIANLKRQLAEARGQQQQ